MISRRRTQFDGSGRRRRNAGRWPRHVAVIACPSCFAITRRVGGTRASCGRVFDEPCAGAGVLSGRRRLAVSSGSPIRLGPFIGGVCRRSNASAAVVHTRRAASREPGHIDRQRAGRLGFGRVMLAQKAGQRPHVATPAKTVRRMVALGAIRAEQLRRCLARGEILCTRRSACKNHHGSKNENRDLIHLPATLVRYVVLLLLTHSGGYATLFFQLTMSALVHDFAKIPSLACLKHQPSVVTRNLQS